MSGGGEECIVRQEYLLEPPKPEQEAKENQGGDGDQAREAAEADGGGDQTNKGNQGKRGKNKNKGRNQNRPPPMKFDRSSRLCPVLTDVPPTAEAAPECKFPNCAFQHDVRKYLKERRRPEGLDAATCPVFQALGRCGQGAACLFSEAHIELVRNLLSWVICMKM